MESIKESDRVRRLERALLALEGLTFLDHYDSFLVDAKYGQHKHKSVVFGADALQQAIEKCDSCVVERVSVDDHPFVGSAYRISHAALGLCGAANHHDETWLDEIESTEASLKELNILDAEKALSRQ